MLKQLRIKFVAVMMLVCAFLLVFFLSLIYQVTALRIQAEKIEMMQSVNSTMQHDGFSPELPQPDDRLHYFVLTRSFNGTLVITGNTSFDLTNTTLLVEIYRTAATDHDHEGVIEDYSLRYCSLNTRFGESYIFADISDDMAALRALRINCFVIGLAALVTLLFLTIILSEWMIRPVDKAWQIQKDFVADASHELKTPLTVIMTNTEMLTSPDIPDEQKTQLIDNTAEMTKRMRFLVEGMLDLARVDNGIVKNTMETVDYSAINEQCVLPFEPLFFESGRFLESEIVPNIRLHGSSTHLAQVTDILLDNAIKYSAPDSTVKLTLRQQGKYALLCVDSPGTPLSDEDLTNIFRRFYTVDKARTGSSYGLGLSIAHGIVTEHGGKIWAESSRGHNRFYVKLPL